MRAYWQDDTSCCGKLLHETPASSHICGLKGVVEEKKQYYDGKSHEMRSCAGAADYCAHNPCVKEFIDGSIGEMHHYWRQDTPCCKESKENYDVSISQVQAEVQEMAAVQKQLEVIDMHDEREISFLTVLVVVALLASSGLIAVLYFRNPNLRIIQSQSQTSSEEMAHLCVVEGVAVDE